MALRRHRRCVATALGFILGLLGAACGDDGGTTQAGLTGRTFLSDSVTEGGAPRPLVGGTRIRIEFHDDGRLTASAGCNTLGGQARVGADTIVVTDLSMTEIGCDPPRHEQDEWLADFLLAEPSYRLDGDRLRLEADGTILEMVDRRSADPDRPLEGVPWRLDGLIDGDVASTVPQGVSIILRFGGGRVTMEGSCNEGGADVEVSGQQLRVGSLVTTDKFCGPAAAAVETAVARVLQGTVAYRIEAASLTLTNSNGAGLMLRAP